MKKSAISITAVLATTVVLLAWSMWKFPSKFHRGTNHPTRLAHDYLMCRFPHHDFGERYGQISQLEHDFRIENVADSPVHLRLSRKSCSCGDVEILPERILPGEVSTVRVKWTPKTAESPTTLYLSIAGDGDSGYGINLSGRVLFRRLYQATPERVELKPQGSDAIDSAEIRVFRYGENTSFDLFSVTTHPNGDHFQAVIKPTHAKNILPISVSILKNQPIGIETIIATNVVINTGDPRQPEIQIPVFVPPRPRISVEPKTILLRLKHGATMQARAVVYWHGDDASEFSVRVAHMSPEGIVDVQVNPVDDSPLRTEILVSLIPQSENQENSLSRVELSLIASTGDIVKVPVFVVRNNFLQDAVGVAVPSNSSRPEE